jgi:hypothetical protein
MDDQTRSLIAIGVFALTILIVVVLILTRFRLDSDAPLIVKLVLSSCFLVLAALTWSLCYMGFVSGAMMSIAKNHSREHDLVTDPAGYWGAVAFAYFLGVVFLSSGAVILLARRTKK